LSIGFGYSSFWVFGFGFWKFTTKTHSLAFLGRYIWTNLNSFSKEILKFSNLKILYLHGNKIMDISELDKLKNLHDLNSLAVHGNPMEKINGFRHYLLKHFPRLKQLNFGGISKADKQTAEVWMGSNKKPMKLPEQIRLEKLKNKKESE